MVGLETKANKMIENRLTEILEKNGLKIGRMISSSKTDYIKTFPFNKVFFNACIFELNNGKEVWYGDIDINDEKTMKSLVESTLEYNEPFLLTVETPYRFGENLKIGNIIDAGGLKFIRTKLGWIGSGKINFDKFSKDEIESLYNNLELAVVTEEGVGKTSDNFDKILFSPEDRLTEEDEYGGIDYIKSGIKILIKFI